MNRSHQPLICQCGCGRTGPAYLMQHVRRQWRDPETNEVRPGSRSWFVRRECREAFECELIREAALAETVHLHAGRSWLGRLWVTPQLYDLQHDIHARRFGVKRARREASRLVVRWLTPKRLALWWTERKGWTKRKERT